MLWCFGRHFFLLLHSLYCSLPRCFGIGHALDWAIYALESGRCSALIITSCTAGHFGPDWDFFRQLCHVSHSEIVKTLWSGWSRTLLSRTLQMAEWVFISDRSAVVFGPITLEEVAELMLWFSTPTFLFIWSRSRTQLPLDLSLGNH